MTTFAAALVLPLRAEVGEGPVWDARNNRLLCVDITAGKTHSFDTVARALRTVDTTTMVGASPLRKRRLHRVGCLPGFAPCAMREHRYTNRADPLETPKFRKAFRRMRG